MNKKKVYSESEEHYHIKYSIAEALKALPNVSDCQVERNLVQVKPDVSFCLEKPDVRVAIEVQKSDISLDVIKKKMDYYYKNKVGALWILPTSSLNTRKLFQKYLYTLYFQRVYMYYDDCRVVPLRINSNNCYDSILHREPYNHLHIVDDFYYLRRPAFQTKYYDVSASALWKDKLRKWW